MEVTISTTVGNPETAAAKLINDFTYLLKHEHESGTVCVWSRRCSFIFTKRKPAFGQTKADDNKLRQSIFKY